MTYRPLLAVAAVCLVALAAWAVAQETLPAADPAGPAQGPADMADPLADAPPTDARHYSYAIGQQIGGSFKEQKLDLDTDSLMAGIKDALSGAKPLYSEEVCAVAIQRMYQQQEANSAKRAQELEVLGEKYLAQNAKAEGVVVLPSGLQYKVLATGSGATPKASDRVRARYRGTFVDGELFDESGPEGVPFSVNGVIPGWTEALQLMKVGDKWQLVVPGNLAYGPEGRDGIPPNAVLVFEVELLAIE